MWSIGVITYMLLSGRPPFYGNDDDETLARVRAGKFAFPAAVFDQISPQGKDFISKLLVVDQGDRMTARAAQEHAWLHCWDQNPEPLRMDIIGSLRNFHQFSTLKRIAMEVVAFTLRPDQVCGRWGGGLLRLLLVV
jgi:calcium-dependent protein kinase